MTHPARDGVSVGTDRRLLAVLADGQASGRLPSLVAAVVRDGEIVWRGFRGTWALTDGTAPVDPFDVQYRIGSITKTFTAVLLLQLARDRVVSLNEPASRWLGEVEYGGLSLRSLLAHSSGMPSEPAGAWWERSPGQTWDELTAANRGDRSIFDVGHQFHYSNLAYGLLGEVVARACGVSWWECVQTRILDPLGLSRTSYLPQAPVAQGWSVHPWRGTLEVEPAADTGAMAPAGQLWSTARDLATYAAFLVSGDDDVLTLARLQEAAHPQTGTRHERLASAPGLGFQLARGGSGMLVGHSGSMPGFLASCFADRSRGTGVAILSNGTTGLRPGLLGQRLLEELEACEPSITPEWGPEVTVPEQCVDILGLWHWGNTPFLLAMESGELVVRTTAGVESQRFRADQGRIVGINGYHDGEELRVARRADGSVSHLEAATFIYTREPYDPDAPIPGGASR